MVKLISHEKMLKYMRRCCLLCCDAMRCTQNGDDEHGELVVFLDSDDMELIRSLDGSLGKHTQRHCDCQPGSQPGRQASITHHLSQSIGSLAIRFALLKLTRVD